MAKKRRLITEENEENYEFTPSDFDEREFILKDMYGTKVLLGILVLSLIVGFVGAAICYYSGASWGWILATLNTFAVMFIIRPVALKLGIRVDLLEGKTLLGDYLVYLVMALGTCIMFVNPPFLA
ncbi:MAG: hypothetical protein PHT00_02545 [Candidatus Methanomethylophilus sp.]|nr:hypothetical protein [Methanomethylophilus sp.]MDD3233033.1 hypothetical protein [Methanomethylophilus sp.]MDD4222281.1 hypothetical protein [Methanomethylophilus sp.]MDD4668874.1 hypothetical protein [Methanomethylophilus sp.]